ncbi:MAG: polysaccharide biosynthesis C-terminal domain-containing protein [Flavobacteriales bacterium]|nr:polysaccharide biosynthesis C-terminal domain-containing protein [Flavobacteriales bacterium]
MLNFLVKPFYILGIDAEFLKRIGTDHPGEYGEYFSIVSLTFIFNIFLDLGLSNFNTKEVAQAGGKLSVFFSSILTLKFLMIFLYLILVFGSGYLLSYNGHQYYLLSFLAINQILVAFILFYRSNLSGMMKFKQDSIVGVLDRVILVVLGVMILWSGWWSYDMSIELFVWLQTGSYAITLLTVIILVYRSGKIPKYHFDLSQLKGLLKKSLPYALLVLLMSVYYRTDSVMIEQMLPNGKREAEIYAQGFRFLEAFSMIGFLFAGLLLPIFSKMLSKKEDVSKLTLLSFRLIFSMSFVLAVGIYFSAEHIIHGRYGIVGDELVRSSESLKMLMICFISMISTYIFGTLLTANGSLKLLNYVALIGVVVNLILNYIWIPSLGAYGAAAASMITQTLTALVQLVLAIRVLKIKIDLTTLVQLSAFVTLLLIIAIFISWDHWLINLVSIFISGAVIAIVTRTFSFKEAIVILRSKE